MPSDPTEIRPIDRAEIVFERWEWPFARDRRGDIDAHFAGLRRDRPGVWNGRALLVRRYTIDGGVLRGTCFETDYASFCAWRAWGFPDAAVFNVFAAGALRGADGAYLLGEMAPSTASAGKLYFPCGTPEPADLDEDGMPDFAGNVGRELLEETGIAVGELAADPGWTLVRDGCYVALLRRLTAPLDADALRARILDHIASEREPELAGIRIVRGPADFTPAMPTWVTAFLSRVAWA